jgi:hypothetical protein
VKKLIYGFRRNRRTKRKIKNPKTIRTIKTPPKTPLHHSPFTTFLWNCPAHKKKAINILNGLTRPKEEGKLPKVAQV